MDKDKEPSSRHERRSNSHTAIYLTLPEIPVFREQLATTTGDTAVSFYDGQDSEGPIKQSHLAWYVDNIETDEEPYMLGTIYFEQSNPAITLQQLVSSLVEYIKIGHPEAICSVHENYIVIETTHGETEIGVMPHKGGPTYVEVRGLPRRISPDEATFNFENALKTTYIWADVQELLIYRDDPLQTRPPIHLNIDPNLSKLSNVRDREFELIQMLSELVVKSEDERLHARSYPYLGTMNPDDLLAIAESTAILSYEKVSSRLEALVAKKLETYALSCITGQLTSLEISSTELLDTLTTKDEQPL